MHVKALKNKRVKKENQQQKLKKQAVMVKMTNDLTGLKWDMLFFSNKLI